MIIDSPDLMRLCCWMISASKPWSAAKSYKFAKFLGAPILRAMLSTFDDFWQCLFYQKNKLYSLLALPWIQLWHYSQWIWPAGLSNQKSVDTKASQAVVLAHGKMKGSPWVVEETGENVAISIWADTERPWILRTLSPAIPSMIV